MMWRAVTARPHVKEQAYRERLIRLAYWPIGVWGSGTLADAMAEREVFRDPERLGYCLDRLQVGAGG